MCLLGTDWSDKPNVGKMFLLVTMFKLTNNCVIYVVYCDNI